MQVLHNGEAAYELSRLLPIVAQLLPEAAPDRPILLHAEVNAASMQQRATALLVTLRVADPAAAGRGLAGPCRLVVQARAGSLPEGAGTVLLEEGVLWTDVHALAEAEELRRRQEQMELQQRAEERQQAGLAATVCFSASGGPQTPDACLCT